ncbi:vWA domain-containing protein [Almyronema epifaneia]|uniref:VWA domain-containing protein n=1 Tax=Almyronema epifaneia S1 TaxID=2991925 RepID=A0ABW6IBX0_9CYAN
MTLPTLELIPMHGAIAAHRSTTLDVLIKISPPAVLATVTRPPLNLSLVIDRSGSMAGPKLDYAKQAACYAIEQLLPSDRISVVLFDTRVQTVVANTLATDKHRILQTIRDIRAGSSTALHAGWVEGGMQVSQYLNPEHLNRVLLLSDGLANVGETNPDAIAQDVHGLSQRGIGTSAMGVGNDYSEDLLEAMARSGDGNFYHIASPDQLPHIFQTELQGLVATVGQKVSLGLSPQAGTTVMDILNDFDKTEYGRLKLPNLVVGNPITVVARLRLPALAQATSLCQVRLAWDDPQQGGRQVLQAALQLPIVGAEQMSDFPANPVVQEQVALLMAARARQEAIAKADSGDLAGAGAALRSASQAFSAMPASPRLDSEATTLNDLATEFEQGHTAGARKKAFSQRFNLTRSRRLE